MVNKLKALLVAIIFLLTPSTLGKAEASLISYPTSYSYISTYFSSWHPGVDMATACGTNIYAAESGTITFSGWDTTGYGNRIDVSEGAYRTLYGHLGYIDKWSGWVNQGDYIGDVGTTGNSTGCHLHFEVWENGVQVNPFNYLP